MASKIRLKVLFFASARELAGVSETDIEIEAAEGAAGSAGARTSQLRQRLAELFPDLASIASEVTLALNMEYLTAEAESGVILKDGDEVALIPPISGG